MAVDVAGGNVKRIQSAPLTTGEWMGISGKSQNPGTYLWAITMPLSIPSTGKWQLVPGSRIRVRQTVTVGARSWPLEVTGVVREVKPIMTGIHTDRVKKDDFWVESVLLEKADGELTRVTFDENTQVEVLKS